MNRWATAGLELSSTPTLARDVPERKHLTQPPALPVTQRTWAEEVEFELAQAAVTPNPELDYLNNHPSCWDTASIDHPPVPDYVHLDEETSDTRFVILLHASLADSRQNGTSSVIVEAGRVNSGWDHITIHRDGFTNSFRYEFNIGNFEAGRSLVLFPDEAADVNERRRLIRKAKNHTNLCKKIANCEFVRSHWIISHFMNVNLQDLANWWNSRSELARRVCRNFRKSNIPVPKGVNSMSAALFSLFAAYNFPQRNYRVTLVAIFSIYQARADTSHALQLIGVLRLWVSMGGCDGCFIMGMLDMQILPGEHRLSDQPLFTNNVLINGRVGITTEEVNIKFLAIAHGDDISYQMGVTVLRRYADHIYDVVPRNDRRIKYSVPNVISEAEIRLAFVEDLRVLWLMVDGYFQHLKSRVLGKSDAGLDSWKAKVAIHGFTFETYASLIPGIIDTFDREIFDLKPFFQHLKLWAMTGRMSASVVRATMAGGDLWRFMIDSINNKRFDPTLDDKINRAWDGRYSAANIPEFIASNID